MKLGYNTNGFAFHRWQDAFEIIAELGYQSVAITVDHHCLNPFAADFNRQIEECRELLSKYELSCVIETGARFLLNPRKKHDPTLLSPTPEARQERIAYLCCCINIGRQLGADAVSFWSGTAPEEQSYGQAFGNLVQGCQIVNAYAEKNNIRIGFEPEPGMLIETMDQYAELKQRLSSENFGLTLDIGHLQCVEKKSIASFITEFAGQIYNIHIEDMKREIHDHLRFGEGEIDFVPVIAELKKINYEGGMHVELSRHSHMAPAVALESIEFLNQLISL